MEGEDGFARGAGTGVSGFSKLAGSQLSTMNEITALITCMTDNERPFIDTAITSTLHQTLPCKTIVFLSEDSNLFDELDSLYPTVTFIRTSLKPLGAMRNYALTFVDTEWVAYLDGDDVWNAQKLEKQLNFIRSTGVDLVGCDYTLINESGIRFAYAMSHYIPAPSSWFARTNVMRDCQFDESPAISEDGRWWTKYARGNNTVSTLRLSEFLLQYRVRGSSLSALSTPGNRKRKLKKLAESSSFTRSLVLASTWVISRLHIDTHYKATLY